MYTKDPQNFIIFDLEWNMAGRRSTVSAEVRQAMPYEIFEVGAIKLDREGQHQAKFQSLIKPVVYTELNRYVAQVTNRVGNSLKYGRPFAEGMKAFRDFCGDDYCFCTWSDSDTKPLKENLAFHKFDDILGVSVLEVQNAFTETFETGGPQRRSEYALDFLRIPKKQPFHQAVSDAWYTAEVLREILLTREADRLGLDTNVLRAKPNQSTAVAEARISAQTRQEMMDQFSYNPDIRLSTQVHFPVMSADEEVEEAMEQSHYACPACEEELTSAIDSWSLHGKHFEQKFLCPTHGDILAKARTRRSKEGKFFLTVNLRLQNS